MADPYNPYTSYSSPTPGGVGYYPPEEQTRQQQYTYQQQQPYGTAEPQPDPNHVYPQPQPQPYHLAPETYQGPPDTRGYTPVEQPDHLGPVAGTGTPPSGKVPENLGYYGHPAEQPRYTPSNPQSPSVYVSDSANQRDDSGDIRTGEHDDPGSERGIGSSLAGGAAGYYFGHKKDHGLLGALGGAIVGSLIENKLKDRDHDHDQPSHGHRHGHHGHGGHHHHHHHHHGHHSRSRSRGHDDV